MKSFALACLSSMAAARQLLGADNHLNLAYLASAYTGDDSFAEQAKDMADGLYGGDRPISIDADGYLNLVDYATGYTSRDQFNQQPTAYADIRNHTSAVMGADGYLNLADYATGYISREDRQQMLQEQAAEYADSLYGAPTAMGADGHLNLAEYLDGYIRGAPTVYGADGKLNLAEYATGYISRDQYIEAAQNADSLYGAPTAMGADGHLNLADYATGYLTEEAYKQMRIEQYEALSPDQQQYYIQQAPFYGAPTAMGADGHLNLADYATGYLTEEAYKQMRIEQYEALSPDQQQYYIQQVKLSNVDVAAWL